MNNISVKENLQNRAASGTKPKPECFRKAKSQVKAPVQNVKQVKVRPDFGKSKGASNPNQTSGSVFQGVRKGGAGKEKLIS